MKVIDRVDNLNNIAMDAKKTLADLKEMAKNTTNILEAAKKSFDSLGKALI